VNWTTAAGAYPELDTEIKMLGVGSIFCWVEDDDAVVRREHKLGGGHGSVRMEDGTPRIGERDGG
jgi:hypothetical protein